MPDYIKIIIFLLSWIIAFILSMAIDWGKIMRKQYRHFGFAIAIVVSLVLGYLLGSMIIAISDLKVFMG